MFDNLVIDPVHINAQVIADSINPVNNQRITTVQIQCPRIILAENNTHRAFSRNYESSRAIPSKIIRSHVLNHPFVPLYWGSNQRGMQAYSELTGWRKNTVRFLWIALSKVAVATHWMMEKIGLHKQTCNRILEPWLSVSGTITSTEWNNFYKLRISDKAQPEMYALATKIKEAISNSTPRLLQIGEAHLPYIDDEEKKKWDLKTCIEVSVARCCRTSYNNRLGKKSQPEEDIKLFNRILNDEHFSPFEHVAFIPNSGQISVEQHLNLQRNFRGWYQFRAFVDNKNNNPLLDRYYGLNFSNNKNA